MYARRVKKRKRFTATEVESDSDEEKDSAEIIYIDNHIWQAVLTSVLGCIFHV